MHAAHSRAASPIALRTHMKPWWSDRILRLVAHPVQPDYRPLPMKDPVAGRPVATSIELVALNHVRSFLRFALIPLVFENRPDGPSAISCLAPFLLEKIREDYFPSRRSILRTLTLPSLHQ